MAINKTKVRRTQPKSTTNPDRVESFGRGNLRMIADEIESALEDLANKYEINITYKGGSYSADGNNASLKLELQTKNPSTGEFNSKEASDFATNCRWLGFKPTDLGRSFRTGNGTYILTGYSGRRSKYPMLGKRADGKRFKFTIDMVKKGFI